MTDIVQVRGDGEGKKPILIAGLDTKSSVAYQESDVLHVNPPPDLHPALSTALQTVKDTTSCTEHWHRT